MEYNEYTNKIKNLATSFMYDVFNNWSIEDLKAYQQRLWDRHHELKATEWTALDIVTSIITIKQTNGKSKEAKRL